MNHLPFASEMGYLPEERIITCRELWRYNARLLTRYVRYLNDNLRREKGSKLREFGQEFDPTLDEIPDH